MSAEMRCRTTLAWVVALGTSVATAGAAQTPELAAGASSVIESLASQGVTSRDGLVRALETAWAAEGVDEYALLRRLGITPTDAEFDEAWQNQAGRAAWFAPYDIEEWATDVLRSWAKVHPRDAFTWMFAVRDRFDFALPRRSAFERVITDWARTSAEAGLAAEAEALAIREEGLREEAVIGVVRGNILRGDDRRVVALMEHVRDPERRREIEALYARYVR
jgi:hypothetical protein